MASVISLKAATVLQLYIVTIVILNALLFIKL